MTGPRSRCLAALLGAAWALLALCAPALASSGQEATFQDDTALKAQPAQTLDTLASLGVDRVRVFIAWSSIAPAAGARHRPSHFDAADPAAYPRAGWAPYDAILEEARARGIGVDFDLAGSVPLWATQRAPNAQVARQWEPAASEFRAFATAVGRRYSGSYRPSGSSGALPRVTYWSIWNEPNVGTSLSPQTTNGGRLEVSPRYYRALVGAGWSALGATGHAHDTVLIGELAPRGHDNPGTLLGTAPLRFLRALYCVDAAYHPLRGSAAATRGCPTSAAGSRAFRRANPALFAATGFAHHPYSLTTPPGARSPNPDWATLADLPRLERALDRLQSVYGSHTRFPIFLTEYGYETNPPRTQINTTPAQQAAYLNQAEYMAWHDPRVHTLAQYLLVDAPPAGGAADSAFASGLVFTNLRAKPSFAAYRLPIYLPVRATRKGHSLEVWGCVRPARNGAVVYVGLQFAPRGKPFATLRTLRIANGHGYFDVGQSFASSGSVRFAWTDPDGQTFYSPTVSIRLR